METVVYIDEAVAKAKCNLINANGGQAEVRGPYPYVSFQDGTATPNAPTLIREFPPPEGKPFWLLLVK